VQPTLATRLDERLASGSVDLPFLPATTSQVLEMCGRDDVDMKDLAGIVGADPTFAAHFLRLSNTALFAARTRIVSLHHAVARLGTNQVRQFVLLITCHARAFHVRGRKALARRMLEHAVATAFFAQEIARARGESVDDAFLSGLLHDIGSPVVLQVISDLEVEGGVALDDETVAQNIDRLHEGVGLEVASQWSTSPALSEAIGSHHRILTADDRSPPAIAVATIQLAEAMAEGVDAEHLVLHPAFALLNLSRADLVRLEKPREVARVVLDSLG